MPQLDFDGANSKVSADKIQGQSGTTVTVPTGHKIAGTDANSITINGVNAVAVAPSTSGNVLTSTGSAWASSAAAGGAWTLLTTANASSSSSINFTSGIDSTYKNYVITITDYVTATVWGGIQMRTSSNGGSSYDSGSTDYMYSIHKVYAGNTNYLTYTSTGAAQTIITTDIGNAGGAGASGMIRIYNPSGTTVQKMFTIEVIKSEGSSGANITTSLGGAVRKSTSAIDAIQLIPSSGTIASGVFKLYGIN